MGSYFELAVIAVVTVSLIGCVIEISKIALEMYIDSAINRKIDKRR